MILWTTEDTVQVQRFLGQHSPALTLAAYAYLLPEDLPEPTSSTS